MSAFRRKVRVPGDHQLPRRNPLLEDAQLAALGVSFADLPDHRVIEAVSAAATCAKTMVQVQDDSITSKE